MLIIKTKWIVYDRNASELPREGECGGPFRIHRSLETNCPLPENAKVEGKFWQR